MTDHDQPDNTTEEAFHGFELTDEQIGDTPFRPVAIELKHLFERSVRDAQHVHEDLTLSAALQEALTEFFYRPDPTTLARILNAAPSMHEPILQITQLVAPSLVRQIPVPEAT